MVLRMMALTVSFLIGLCINNEVALFKNTFVVLFRRKIINYVLELFITLTTMVSLILINLSRRIQ